MYCVALQCSCAAVPDSVFEAMFDLLAGSCMSFSLHVLVSMTQRSVQAALRRVLISTRGSYLTESADAIVTASGRQVTKTGANGCPYELSSPLRQ